MLQLEASKTIRTDAVFSGLLKLGPLGVRGIHSSTPTFKIWIAEEQGAA